MVGLFFMYGYQFCIECIVKLAQEKSGKVTDRPDMTIAVDWEVEHQAKQRSSLFAILKTWVST